MSLYASGGREEKVSASSTTSEALESLLESNKSSDLESELAATSQKILELTRMIDKVPCELDMSQYQKRYVELQRLSFELNNDLKRLYLISNSLDLAWHHFAKEISLLHSREGNFRMLPNRHQSKENLH